MTARWVVDEVKDRRNLNITWQPISLLLKNQPAENGDHYAPLLKTFKMLRVMESVRAGQGNDGVFALYWEFGRRIHHDGDHDFEIAAALKAAGLPTSHAVAAESEEFDAEIRSRHDAGLALVGDDVGTPIIAMTDPRGIKQGIFGPVITKVPSPEDSIKLWDSVATMLNIDGFWELKRTRTQRPEVGDRP